MAEFVPRFRQRRGVLGQWDTTPLFLVLWPTAPEQTPCVKHIAARQKQEHQLIVDEA